jgi:transposase-like protein
MAKAKMKSAPPAVARSARRRSFSEEAKRRIVGEASRPGGSLSEVVSPL